RVSRAVHVRLVTRRRLVLHLRRVDRDTPRLLLRRRVDRRVVLRLATKPLRQHRRDRRRQRRLAMVHVTNRAHVHVRLRPLEFAFCHYRRLLLAGCLSGLSFAPRTDRSSSAFICPPPRCPSRVWRRVAASCRPPRGSVVPMARIERATSPLPRECSTTEPHGRKAKNTPPGLTERPILPGAGEGNRTLVVSLEGFCSTIELHPPA